MNARRIENSLCIFVLFHFNLSVLIAPDDVDTCAFCHFPFAKKLLFLSLFQTFLNGYNTQAGWEQRDG